MVLLQMNTVEKAPLLEGLACAAGLRWLLPWLFLAPALTIYVVVVVYPMAYSAYLSFFKWDGVSPTKQFVGLQNYLTLLLNDPVFLDRLAKQCDLARGVAFCCRPASA